MVGPVATGRCFKEITPLGNIYSEKRAKRIKTVKKKKKKNKEAELLRFLYWFYNQK